MKKYTVGDEVKVPEFDGFISKTIYSIICRDMGKFNGVEKLQVLEPAKDWCIILFDDNTWIEGRQLPAID